jgi:hypothetical protein
MEYRLDLSTLLTMLGQSTGILSSKLQSIPGVKKHCQILIRLEKGAIAACSIKDEEGHELFSGNTALKRIQHLVLEWNYIEEQKRPNVSQKLVLAQSPEEIKWSSIPQRTYPIPQQEFLSWPRIYRSIYSLIDGKSSVYRLSGLLGHEQGPEHILAILTWLHEQKFIYFT